MPLRAITCVLYGESDDRLRATWRALVPFLSATVFEIVAVVTLRVVVTAVHPPYSAAIDQLAVGVITLLALAVVLAVSRRLDRRPITEYGLEISGPSLRNLGVGLLIGVLMSGVPIAFGVALGYGRITTYIARAGTGSVILVLALLVFGQIGNVLYEEVLFRSVMLSNFVEGMHARLDSRSLAATGGITAASIVFGLSHVLFAGGGGSQGRSLHAVVSAALFGVAWGVAYVLSGRLALPIGIHLAYNLSNGFLFQVSAELAAGRSFPALVRIGETAPWFWHSSALTLLRFAVTIVCVGAWIYTESGRIPVPLGLG